MNLGSGGYGTSGGGAVILNIANTLVVNGSIIANGAGGSNQTGSGGSIYLTAGALTGTGTGLLSADGGGSSGGGSGGRIAVIASTSVYSGSYQAYGTSGFNGQAAA